jgi:predicted ATP-binding protein involved in virulence
MNMLTPQEFPYISSIYVNDCYAYQNFNIELANHDDFPFSHLILTGKNGSGKSTILREIVSYSRREFIGLDNHFEKHKRVEIKEILSNSPTIEEGEMIKKLIGSQKVVSFFTREVNSQILSLRGNVFSYLKTDQRENLADVNSPIKNSDFDKNLYHHGSLAFLFKQYLVNKKIDQAFAQLKNDQTLVDATNVFFSEMEKTFGEILEDKELKLVFVEDDYEFLLRLSDDRELTFNVLPDGFSALFSILMDLFLRVDLIRKNVGNYTYDPCGIVLIDEPETHLHLSLQYQVLPLLTSLFPNVQFIVATHSPAVISSIKHVTVFDLSSREVLSDEVVGKSFSELMVSHFRLDNEFSPPADAIFDEINHILQTYRKDVTQRNQKLRQILEQNKRYISAGMRFELESKILETE